ncbi:hypothetical protein NDU88_001874 [Pleurodeles waltl]|uniref:Uncharacterized protein n=1 Tax=Pleurodeles waltl TaxID=8319 RepID=A0AAV7TLE1_PLEWA|nr:hypothetical protein NDU88_001874 [Pleurodeles waltl]
MEGLLCDRDPELTYVRGVAERRAAVPRLVGMKAGGCGALQDTPSEQTDSESGGSDSTVTETPIGPVITPRTADELCYPEDPSSEMDWHFEGT